jgi:hypothetical protein
MVLALAVVAAGLAWMGASALREPALSRVVWTAADRASAQQKILTLAARRGRPAEVILSERELTALVAGYLAEHSDQSIGDVSVRLPASGRVQVAGRLSARRMAQEVGLAAVDWLPARWGDRPVWVHLDLSVRTTRDPRPQVRLRAERFYLGRLRVPASLYRLVLSPLALGLLQWNLPAGVDSIRVEPGRAVVRLADQPRLQNPGSAKPV